MSTPALAAPDPHRLARAFMALSDDGASEPFERSALTLLAAALATLTLAVAAPLSWMAPVAHAPQKSADQPAATLASSKAGLHAADDEDEPGGD
jgi:hypothetical protein